MEVNSNQLEMAFNSSNFFFLDKILSAIAVTKFHRRSPKTQVGRFLVLTANALHLLHPETGDLRDRIPLEDISGITLTNFKDGVMVLHCKSQRKQKNMKGDVIVRAVMEGSEIEFASRAKLAKRGLNVELSHLYVPIFHLFAILCFIFNI